MKARPNTTASSATSSPTEYKPRVLAISSGGGHWAQLLRLGKAWEACDIAYACTHKGYESDIVDNEACAHARFYVVPDANRSEKVRLIWQLAIVALVLIRERPEVVVTTGASVGYFALRLAKLFRRRTVWVDSIANADELSLTGKIVAPYADLWLTQWKHLSDGAPTNERSPLYLGAVL